MLSIFKLKRCPAYTDSASHVLFGVHKPLNKPADAVWASLRCMMLHTSETSALICFTVGES